MEMNEFGCNQQKKILFIHGAGTSYKMWTAQIEMLSGEYHLYVPTLNGHVIEDGSEYENPAKEAKELLKWFENHGIGQIHLIVGASLGAYVVEEMLLLRPDFAKYAFIESLKSYHYGTVMTRIFSALGEKMLRKAASVEGIMEGSYQKEYVSDDMKYVLSHMTKESIQHVLLTAANYSVPKRSASIKAKTLIVYGSKEEKLCKENTKLLKQQMKECQCIVMDGYNHGELAIGNPRQHVEMLKKWISEKD